MLQIAVFCNTMAASVCTTIIVFDKNNSVYEQKVKNLQEQHMFKKCGFKTKSDDFGCLYTWSDIINGDEYIFKLFGKTSGKAPHRNLYATNNANVFPFLKLEKPIYGNCVLVASKRCNGASDTYDSITLDIVSNITHISTSGNNTSTDTQNSNHMISPETQVSAEKCNANTMTTNITDTIHADTTDDINITPELIEYLIRNIALESNFNINTAILNSIKAEVMAQCTDDTINSVQSCDTSDNEDDDVQSDVEDDDSVQQPLKQHTIHAPNDTNHNDVKNIEYTTNIAGIKKCISSILADLYQNINTSIYMGAECELVEEEYDSMFTN